MCKIYANHFDSAHQVSQISARLYNAAIRARNVSAPKLIAVAEYSNGKYEKLDGSKELPLDAVVHYFAPGEEKLWDKHHGRSKS